MSTCDTDGGTERPGRRDGPRGPKNGTNGTNGAAGSYWSGYDLLWGLRDTPTPSRRTAIDRRKIVDAAIAIADREGLAAVTMRNVATALRMGTMSLYRHVPDKDALVSLMVDAVIAGGGDETRTLESLPEGWRDRLRLVAESVWRVCREHRWFPEASMVRPPITPSGIAGFEFALSIFDGYDLDIDTKALYVGFVYSTVVGAALRATIEEDAQRRAEMSLTELYAAGRPFFERLVTSGAFPRVSAFIVEADHVGPEAEMRAAVELVLDGIAARLASVSVPEARERL